MSNELQVRVADPAPVEPSAEGPAPRRILNSQATTVLFALTAFLGAALLFVVQPMVTRFVLPRFGGSATVWSTSSLFFQVVLLLGYVYVHVATNRLRRRAQIWVHLVVLLVPLLALPVAAPAMGGEGGYPAIRLLAILTVMIGLPFAVLSTTGPLVQRWYSWTPAARNDDPYFLFAASNLGSFGGLLAYPLVIERALTLDQQRIAWSVAFVVLLVLVAGCGVVAVRSPARASAVEAAPAAVEHVAAPPPARRVQLTWLGLAFLPSALLLAVTSHMSTDVAAVPLLWVVPLAIYLATFVIAFARTSRTVNPTLVRAAGAVAAVALLTSVITVVVPIGVAVAVDLAVLALVALVAHSRLAAMRPSVEHLTRFYLVVALGGAAGGLLNGLVAPLVFDRVWEYPGALVGSLLLGVGTVGLAGTRLTRRYGRPQGAVLLALLLAVGGLVLVGLAPDAMGTWWVLPLCAVALVSAWLAAGQPWSLAGGMVLLVVIVTIVRGVGTLETTRTFYGSYRVSSDAAAHRLMHGNTVHGSQLIDQPTEPTLYYGRFGPLGQALSVIRPTRTAVVGLGTGTIAAYGEPGDAMTFYEIDPEVDAIARDPQLFTYLRDTEAAVTTVVGDGRLQIAKAPEAGYDVIVLDAFSSDAVPVHLLTEEAFDTYASRLAPDGAILAHISNRYLDLEPVVAASADHLGWDTSVGRNARAVAPATEAVWVLVTPNTTWTAEVRGVDGWRPVGTERIPWTDDYSSVLSVLATW